MGSFNVLIVDDAALLRRRLKVELERIPGLAVVGEAATVQDGIESFRKLNPDAVILDVLMPGGTGIDVLEAIKRERPRTLVMVLTNHPFVQLRRKAIGAGAEFFFDKCCEIGRVAGVFRDIVVRRTRP